MKTDSPIQRRASRWGAGRHRDTGRLGDPVYRACGRGPAAPRRGPRSRATSLRAPSRELFRVYTEQNYLDGVGDGRVCVIGRPPRSQSRSRALLALAAAFLLVATVARQLAMGAGNRRTEDGPSRLPAASSDTRLTPFARGRRPTLPGLREGQREELRSRKQLRGRARSSHRRVASSVSPHVRVRRTVARAWHPVSRPLGAAAAAAPSAARSASARVASPALPAAAPERARGHGRPDFTFERR